MNRKPVRMVLDTDTYNEVDDQFALSYALLSPELAVEAVYAAPFHNERSEGSGDGMERSYGEIRRLLGLLGRPHEGFAFRGSDRYMGNRPCESEAASDLIARARTASPEDKLTVVAIGAPTNVSSALVLAPDIVPNVRVVWLGGHDYGQPETCEFNMMQDYEASALLFDLGVELVQVPCHNVASHLSVSVPELRAHLSGSALGRALTELVYECVGDRPGATRIIWDISTIAYVINPDWAPAVEVHAPVLDRSMRYSFDRRRHLIRCVWRIDRDAVFGDLFRKLGALKD